MGGCATKPKVLKADETEAPAEVEVKEEAVVEEVAAKDEGVVADNDSKRQSLGFLFEVKYINAWNCCFYAHYLFNLGFLFFVQN